MANLKRRVAVLTQRLYCRCGAVLVLACSSCSQPPPPELTDEERAARIVAILTRAEARRAGRLPWPVPE
jgi:hypothetical protein